MGRGRKIIHIDMDAFYASVEQRDNPTLQGKPLIVGGEPDSRGVVAAASYEARKFGVRSAMSSSRAKALCPQAIFVRPQMRKYRRISNSVFGILREYSDLVEPLSLDEAFVDVTENKKNLRYAREVAKDMRAKIYEYTGLTASCGLADCKFLAKIASDLNKPNGMAIITPENKLRFLENLPIRKIPGVGRVTEERMLQLGISTVGRLREYPLEDLKRIFGKSGIWYYQLAQGIDDREVQPNRERKSIGSENTFLSDTKSKEFLHSEIEAHAERISSVLRKKGMFARTITVKVKYADFTQITRSKTSLQLVSSMDEIIRIGKLLLDETEAFSRPVRLLGVSVSGLELPIQDPQLALFGSHCGEGVS